MRKILFWVVIFMSCACENTATDQYLAKIIRKDINAILDRQVKDWNEGDIEAYMSGYWRSDSLRFASGGTISFGWEKTLKRYKQGYPDRKAMGFLAFSDIDIKVISDRYALVFGKWSLKRENDQPRGLFTLVFNQTKNGWKIVHDHTSSALAN